MKLLRSRKLREGKEESDVMGDAFLRAAFVSQHLVSALRVSFNSFLNTVRACKASSSSNWVENSLRTTFPPFDF